MSLPENSAKIFSPPSNENAPSSVLSSAKAAELLPSVTRFATAGGIRIYRIKNQTLPHLTSYVHLFLGPDGFLPTLLDTGSGEGDSYPQILEGLRRVASEFGERFEPTDIKRIIISHAHVDHFGGTSAFARLTKAEIVAHRFDSRMIASFNERATVANHHYARFLLEAGIESGNIDDVLRAFNFLPGRIRSVPVTRFVEDGEILDGMTIRHFPGHSAGQLGIQIENILFSADLILSKTLTQNWPESLFPYCGFGRYLESLARLEKLAQASGPEFFLLPAHESPVMDVPRRVVMVRKAEMRRMDRLFDILDNAEEPLSTNEIARKMYLTVHQSRTFFALCDVAARLEYLQLRGEIAAANYDEIGPDQPVIRFRRC